MILILKNADFSRNNIGNIPIINPLTDETLRIMQSYSKFPVEQKNEYVQALNSFIAGAKEAGIYDKISVLAIPILAANIGECSVNVKNGARIANETYFKKLFALNESGELYRTAETFGDTTEHCGYDITHNSNDFMMFGIYDAGSINIDQMAGAKIAGWYGFKNKFDFIESGPSGQVVVGGANVSPQGEGNVALLGAFGTVTTAYVLSAKAGFVYYKDKRITRTGVYGADSASLMMYYPLVTKTSNAQSNGSYLLYGCGYSLTETETATLYSLLADFYNAVKA